MAKRFTDTDKWKKPFIRGLQGAYKLLWLYILDDCDHAGIWQVDFEVARIRIGEQIDREQAISAFGDRIEIFNAGSKWFLRDFIEFQYGQLSEKNRMHLSVINILTKNEIGAYKPLTRGQGQGQGNGQDEGQGQGNNPEFENYEKWTDQILDNNDQHFEAMFMNEGLKMTPAVLVHWVRDHLGLLGRYPNMKPPDQQRFRGSCMKHIRENYKKQITGNGTSKNSNLEHIAGLKEARNNAKTR